MTCHMLVHQVDDCIAKYEWMAHMTKQMAALKRAGKPLPQSVEEMEGMLGEHHLCCCCCALMQDDRLRKGQHMQKSDISLACYQAEAVRDALVCM